MKGMGTPATLFVAALLAASMHAGVAQGQAPQRPDLEVGGIEIIGPTPKWVDGVATSTRIEVSIANVGQATSSDGYRIEYYWSKDGVASWLNGDEAQSIDLHAPASTEPDGPTSGSSLARGEARKHQIDWRLQQGQVGFGDLRVRILPYGLDADAANDVNQTNGFHVPAHHIIVHEPDSTEFPLRLDEAAFLRVPIENRGNVPEIVDVRVVGSSGAAHRLVSFWSPADIEAAGLLIPAQQTKNADLVVEFPFSGTGDDSPFAVAYGIEFVRTYDVQPQVIWTPDFVLLDEALPAGSAFELQRVDDGRLVAVGGDSDVAEFRLKNTGSLPDIFLADVEVSAAGWTGAAVPEVLTLEPGEEKTFQAVIDFPAAVAKGSMASANVTTISHRDAILGGAFSQREVMLQVRGAAMVVGGSGLAADAYAGDPRILAFQIDNIGSQDSGRGALHVTIQDGDDETELVVAMESLAPGEQTELTVPAGTYPSGVATSDIRAEWKIDELGSPGPWTRPLLASISIRNPLLVIEPPGPTSGVAGEVVPHRTSDYVFRVTNTGTAAEDVSVSITSSAGDVTLGLETRSLSLGVGESAAVPFDVMVPKQTHDAEAVVVELEVSIDGRPDLMWRAEAAVAIHDETPPDISVASPVPVSWPLGQALPVSFSVADAADVKRVEVAVLGEEGALLGEPPSHEDSPGNWAAVFRGFQTGKHVVRINAEDMFGNANAIELGPIDIQGPTSLNISFLNVTDGDQLTHNETVAVEVSGEQNVAVAARVAYGPDLASSFEQEVVLDAARVGHVRLLEAVGRTQVRVVAIGPGGAGANVLNITVAEPQPPANETAIDAEDATEQAPGPGIVGGLVAMLAGCLFRRRRRDFDKRPTGNGHKAGDDRHFFSNRMAVAKKAPSRTSRSRSAKAGSAIALAAIIVASTLLVPLSAGPDPMSGPAGSHGAKSAEEGVTARASLWSALPAHLDPFVAFGPAARMAFDDSGGHPDLLASPESAHELFDRIIADTQRHPVPTAPPGPEPLLQAIRSLDDLAELPPAPLLAEKIDALRLRPEAEEGLARLVSAYGQSLRLEEEAMGDLTDEERRVIRGDPVAVAAWEAAHPDGDLEAYQGELRAKTDVAKLLMAADLMVRTVEAVKDVISLPPLPDDPAPAGPVATADTKTAEDDDAWHIIGELVTLNRRGRALDMPELPEQTLADALVSLAQTLGIPDEVARSWEAPNVPPSLDHALAQIVTARWVGLRMDDVNVHARLMVEATQAAMPTLKAWGAVLAMEAPDGMSATEPLLRWLSLLEQGTPSPASFIADEPTRASFDTPPIAALADRLVKRGNGFADAEVQSVPPDVLAAVELVLTGADQLDTAREAHLQEVEAYQAQMRDLQKLLNEPTWTGDQAAQVEALTAHPVPQVAMAGLAEGKELALHAVEAAVALLQARSEGGLPGSPAMATTNLTTDVDTSLATATPCAPQSPVSDCPNDILLYVPSTLGSPGVLVTGDGSSTITTSLFSPAPPPAIIIDLGGDDEMLVAAGAASASSPFSVLIDVAGDDTYESGRPSDHGSAVGAGTLGVLWDLGGDDAYRLVASLDPQNAGQGFGADGGTGILVDQGGQDTYFAPWSLAQGIGGRSPPPGDTLDQFFPMPNREVVSHGMLLDLGQGSDSFEAYRGQGYGAASYARALLYNEQGAAVYDTTLISSWYQGGVSPSSGYAIGALVDLGGTGTAYSNYDLPPPATTAATSQTPGTSRSSHPTAPYREDQRYWILSGSWDRANYPHRSWGLGLDSTTQDENGDSIPDTADSLGSVSLGDVLALLQELVDPENPPDPEELLDPDTLGGLVFPLPGDAVAEASGIYAADVTAPRRAMCDIEAEERRPYHLLRLTSPFDDEISGIAHIHIDLGGNDHYTDEVAGPGEFCVGTNTSDGLGFHEQDAAQYYSGGSYALDIIGDDHYDTPGNVFTQGAVASKSPAEIAIPYQFSKNSLSMLVEAAGNDRYEAASFSQGAAWTLLSYNSILDPIAESSAWLIDLVGDDEYVSFDRSQGFTGTFQAAAGLLDLAGDDEYTFRTQARVEHDAAGPVQLAPLGVFFDRAGQDRYISNSLLSDPGSIEDPLHGAWYADQATVHNGAVGFLVNGMRSYAPVAVFIDDGVERDTYDRLSVENPPTYENISHIKNNRIRSESGVNSGNLINPGIRATLLFIDGLTAGVSTSDEDGDGGINLIETLAGTDTADGEDHAGSVWQNPADLSAEEPWFHIKSLAGLGAGGFIITGTADHTHAERRYDFLVDLGGDDAYRTDGIGSGMLNLDVGGGDDEYAPVGALPNLGASDLGIAILADDGGTNRFQSSADLTQGAALQGGVGIVLTWDAQNRFEATAATAAQAAAVGIGVGILASFGRGDDQYIQHGSGIAQAASDAWGKAYMIDGGGTNTYWAPAARAQASAMDRDAVAILYAGDGNDAYMAGSQSQAFAIHPPISQYRAVAMLIEPGGEDVYVAEDWSQGAAGIQAAAWLLDMGGFDSYRGNDHVQGAVGAGQSVAMFMDLQGDDQYHAEGPGHGWSQGECGAVLFLDGGGEDAYSAAREKVQLSEEPPSSTDNDWTWGQTGCSTAIGIDDASVASAFEAATRMSDDIELTFVGDDGSLADGDTTDGADEITLRALVAGSQSSVRRVTFFLEGQVYATGTHNPDGGSGGVAAFDHVVALTSAAFPDGDYSFHAVAHEEPAGASGSVGTPDTAGRRSATHVLLVDGPPDFTVEMDGDFISPDRHANVTIDLVADRDFPQGATAWSGCADVSAPPGGTITLTVHNGASDYTAFQGYCPAGTIEIPLHDAALAGTPWNDGLYNVTVSIEDSAGSTTDITLAEALRVDSTPPVSSIPISVVPATQHAHGEARISLLVEDINGSGVDRIVVLRFNRSDDSLAETIVVPGDADSFKANASHGDVLRFLTIAVDRAGNVEAPCRAYEALDSYGCYHQKFQDVGSHDVAVDIEPPFMGRIDVSRPFLRPPETALFSIDIEDEPAGVSTAVLRFIDIDGTATHVINLTSTDGVTYSGERTFTEPVGSREVPLNYEVVATDNAGNAIKTRGQLFLDGLAPRVTAVGTDYFQLVGSSFEDPRAAGAPGRSARVRLHIQDVPGVDASESMASVLIDTSSLNASAVPSYTACWDVVETQTAGDWTCLFTFADDVIDGVYELPVSATDAAGNQNLSLQVPLIISTKPFPVADLVVPAVHHDGFEVSWNTTLDSDARVLFGRSAPAPGEPLPFVFEGPAGERKEHRLRVEGLSPATEYYFQVVSESSDGVISQSLCASTDCTAITTINSYSVSTEGIDEGAFTKGVVEIDYAITFRAGTHPVDAQFFIRDAAGRASPIAVTERMALLEGAGRLLLDTTDVADGEYVLRMENNRAGDRLRHDIGPFWIDNTAPVAMVESPLPGARVPDAKPRVSLVLLDPGGEPPTPQQIDLSVQGVAWPWVVESDGPFGPDGRKIVLLPLQDLGHGPHEFMVSLQDSSGNIGSVAWDIMVDLIGPELLEATVEAEGDFTRSRPGGPASVTATFDDDSGVAAASLDASALGGQVVPLVFTQSTWKASFTVPENALSGTYVLPVFATDVLGNPGQEALVEFVVDDEVPTVASLHEADIGFTTARLNVQASEDVRIRIAGLDWGNWSKQHMLDVRALVPGSEQAVTLVLQDRAGLTNIISHNVTTKDDLEPPGKPVALEAVVFKDGSVRLTWKSASDNAGISHYQILREARYSEPASWEVRSTDFIDAEPPPAVDVTYTVAAIDVGGHQGNPAVVHAKVPAPPVLKNATVTPGQGPATAPFEVSALYVHLSGEHPKSIVVTLGSEDFLMVADDAGSSCRLGCRYSAKLHLQPTSYLSVEAPITIESVDADGLTTLLEVTRPIVLGDAAREVDPLESRKAPGLHIIGSVLSLLTIALAVNRKRKEERP